MAHVYAIGDGGGAAGGVFARHYGRMAGGYAAFVSLSGETGLTRLGSLKTSGASFRLPIWCSNLFTGKIGSKMGRVMRPFFCLKQGTF